MSKELQSQKVAILAADGVKRIELEQPRGALHGAGATTELVSIHDGTIKARQMDLASAARLRRERGEQRRQTVTIAIANRPESQTRPIGQDQPLARRSAR